MADFTKRDLETTYNTKFSDADIEIINQEMIYGTLEELEEDTRYFDNLQAYVDYVYLDNLSNARTLIKEIARCINEAVKPIDFILPDSNDILLPNDRYILVLE